MTITQFFDPALEQVADEFFRLTSNQEAGGASLAIFQEGECVLDLKAGEACAGSLWTDETVSVIFSCTKGLSSVLVGTLIEDGSLDPEQPVQMYWPEFSVISRSLTIRELFEHKGGLAAVIRDMSLTEVLNHDEVVGELLKQGALWPPGSGHAYHAITFGNLVTEIIKRVKQKSVGAYFQEIFTLPLSVDAWLGVPSIVLPRVAELISAAPFGSPLVNGKIPLHDRALTFGTALPFDEAFEPNNGYNSQAVRQAELPGVNAITNAFGLAKIWSSTVASTSGIRTINDQTIASLTQLGTYSQPVFGPPVPWPHRGFGVMVEMPEEVQLFSPAMFGHAGLGGQAGYADPTTRSSFGYVSNYLVPGALENHRWHSLMKLARELIRR